VGDVLLAREEPHERPPAEGALVADGAPQHRVAGFEGVEHGALGDDAFDIEVHLAVHLRQRPQGGGEHHADHGSVCASTDRTAGRSRTIGAQLSPASADPYTWPPVVPTYSPHGSRPSTAIASRSTLT